MSSIDIMIGKYEHARSELEATVQIVFPIGSKVRVGENPSIAEVRGYSESSPEWVYVLFENGNIWEKPVRSLALVTS